MFNVICLNQGHDIKQYIDMIRNEIVVPAFSKQYIASHIFDEEKSVRWNREEVERRNKEHADYCKSQREKQAELFRQLDEAIIKYVQSYNRSFTREVAVRVIEFAKFTHESNWWDWIDDCIDFADNIVSEVKT